MGQESGAGSQESVVGKVLAATGRKGRKGLKGFGFAGWILVIALAVWKRWINMNLRNRVDLG
jgi:hypothetical protein